MTSTSTTSIVRFHCFLHACPVFCVFCLMRSARCVCFRVVLRGVVFCFVRLALLCVLLVVQKVICRTLEACFAPKEVSAITFWPAA